MAIKIGAKKRSVTVEIPKGFRVLFGCSIFLFVFSVGSYFLIDYMEEETKEKTEEIRMEIEKVQAEVPDFEMKKKEVLEFEKRINDYRQLLEDRVVVDPFLDILEQSTHSQVQLLNVGVDTRSGRMEITGIARDLEVLEQQHYIYKDFSLTQEGEVIKDPIKEVKLELLIKNYEEDKILFDFLLHLDPGLFKAGS